MFLAKASRVKNQINRLAVRFGAVPNHMRRLAMSSRDIYEYTPYGWTSAKLDELNGHPVAAPRTSATGNAAARFNTWLAVKVTSGVGTMWCAYAFAAIACISLPAAISSNNAVTIVSWISQTFLQLVLLSVVIVGQNILAREADARAEITYNDANAVIHEAVKLQEHLLAQDRVLSDLVARLSRAEGEPSA